MAGKRGRQNRANRQVDANRDDDFGAPDNSDVDMGDDFVEGTDEGSGWSSDQVSRFFDAFQEHGQDWAQVSQLVGKTAQQSEALYKQHSLYLNLASQLIQKEAFMGMVKGYQEHSLQHQIQPADSANLSEGMRGYGARSTSAGGAQPHSPRDDSLHSTPRHHIKSREPASVPKGAARTPTSAQRQLRKPPDTEPAWGTRARRTTGVSATEMLPLGHKRKRVQTKLFGDDFVRDDLRPGKTARRRKVMEPGGADEAQGADALLSLATLAEQAESDSQSAEEEEGSGRRSGRYAPRRYHQSPQYYPRPVGTTTPRRGRAPAAHHTPRRSGRQAEGERRSGGHSSGRRTRHATAERHAGESRHLDFEEQEYWEGSGEELEMQGDDEEADMRTQEELMMQHRYMMAEASDPVPRQRRRKAAPERVPPMMSPIKSLYGRRTTAGIINIPSVSGCGFLPTSATSFLLPGMEGEGGDEVQGQNEVRLRHALDPRTRRWARAEFFCSALDRPWLADDGVQTLCNHFGLKLGQLARLTRTEWTCIRRSLGRPRRLSLAFLRQERAELEAWRERVRAKYEEVGYGAQIPPDLPRQLQVGQRVTARHPVTRQIHDGDILTTAPKYYRVQFDRREMGVERVRDVDVMPINPTENLPASFIESHSHILMNGHAMVEGQAVQHHRGTSRDGPPARGPAAGRAQQEARAAAAAAQESDMHTLSEVAAALDRKERLLTQLRSMNDEAEKCGPDGRKAQPSDQFRQAYAQVVMQLKQVNEVLEALLQQLQAHNNPHASAVQAAINLAGSSLHPHKPMHQGVKQEGQGSAMDWNALLANAKAMVQRHQGQLAEELKTDSANAPTQQALQQQQQPPQHQQASLHNGEQPAAAPAAGGPAGDNQTAGPASNEQNSTVGDEGGATVKQESGPAQNSEEARLSNMVSGCVAMLLTMQRCAQQPVAGHSVNAALINSLKMLQPHAASNQPIFRKIEQTVMLLRNQLLQGSPN
ncbi:hypothetical protein ABBQ38_007180 [Trebouxia sp. C0009 RCD-2024]